MLREDQTVVGSLVVRWLKRLRWSWPFRRNHNHPVCTCNNLSGNCGFYAQSARKKPLFLARIIQIHMCSVIRRTITKTDPSCYFYMFLPHRRLVFLIILIYISVTINDSLVAHGDNKCVGESDWAQRGVLSGIEKCVQQRAGSCRQVFEESGETVRRTFDRSDFPLGRNSRLCTSWTFPENHKSFLAPRNWFGKCNNGRAQLRITFEIHTLYARRDKWVICGRTNV